jgi:hypothetical protein
MTISLQNLLLNFRYAAMLNYLKRIVRNSSPNVLELACFYLTAVVLIMLINAIMTDSSTINIALHSVCVLLNISALIMLNRAGKGKDQ